MKYPKLNKKELDVVNKRRFAYLKTEIVRSIEFDNKENELGLTKKDIEILSWNLATNIISRPY